MNPFVAIIYSMWFVDSLSFCLQHQPPSSTPPPETRRPGPLCRRCHTWPPQSHSGRPGPDPAHRRRRNSAEIRPHLCLILVFLGVTVTSCSWTSLNIIEHHWTVWYGKSILYAVFNQSLIELPKKIRHWTQLQVGQNHIITIISTYYP